MADADALEGGKGIEDKGRDERLVAAALLLAHQVTEDSEELVARILRQRNQIRAGEGASRMADDRDTLWKELAELKSAVSLLETRVDGRLGSLAPRDWVHEILQPLQSAVTKMEASVTQLSEDAKELFDTHKQMLKEKGERERQEWAERTPLGIVKKYAPLIGFLVGAVALFRVLGTMAEAYIQAHK